MSPSTPNLTPLLPEPVVEPSDELQAELQHGETTQGTVEGQSFTWRGVGVGFLIGLAICFSNMYFGLQTGWVSIMSMPSSLLGYGIFRTLAPHLSFPFSPAENVLVQTVAGSMAIMPLGCGFVGVMPAMNYLLAREEQGPISLPLWKLLLWSLGLCYFGVVFAVPLRRQVLVREKLKFPSGFSTAVLIGVLHGGDTAPNARATGRHGALATDFASLAVRTAAGRSLSNRLGDDDGRDMDHGALWPENGRSLLVCFLVSGLLTLVTYFFPVLRSLPVFGTVAASRWLWTLNPSLAYVGQGIVMGPATTSHMLLGAVAGWAVLSPLAKSKGWAPGRVDDWENGSKGWIVWISLAMMLADALVSLGWLALRPLVPYLRLAGCSASARRRPSAGTRHDNSSEESNLLPGTPADAGRRSADHGDAPPGQLVGDRTVVVGLVVSVFFCIACIDLVFGHLVPLYATVVAVGMALLLSIMGVRALGETDLNPVSGISKLAQLFFLLVVPQSNASSVLVNLVAGAVSEAGALQSGDMMQDLKTGHLLGASPRAQFYGQCVGATAGAVASALIYRFYTNVYRIPGDLFEVPTAYVWIFTARMVTGRGLPDMAREWSMGAAVLFAVLTGLRIWAAKKDWHGWIPGGIAVAVGMYNVPSFTLARAAGGLLAWWWRSVMGWHDSPLIVIASGLILGEGFLSIVNLVMSSLGVSHF